MKKHLGLLLAASLLSLAACDGDNANNDDGGTITLPDVPRPDVQTATDTGTTPTDTGTGTDSGTTTDSGTGTDSGTTTDSGTGTDAGTGTDSGTDAGADAGTGTDAGAGMYVDGCYVGTPVQMTDFLNRCSTATAFPARAARGSRLLPDGGVQALP